MSSPVIKYSIHESELPILESEVLRYLGYSRPSITEEDKMLVRGSIKNARQYIAGKGCFARYPVKVYGDGRIDLPYATIISHDLSKNLEGCDEIFIMAATIGSAFDRAIKTVKVKSIAEAAIYQAIGATAVEDVVDGMNAILEGIAEEEGKRLKPRYSPGFGDYQLDNQKGIFKVLNPEKYAGITLMDTLIMAPEKSVTAIVGLYN